MRLATLLLLTTLAAHAQWELQDSHTGSDLRGIRSVGNGIAWASGTEGTVLRTTNDGKDWQRCATPPDADNLDFRGIQAFDTNSAIVMSSGKGPLSRLYETTDACQTWALLRTNDDDDGLWDALVFKSPAAGELVGDPVKGHFVVFSHIGPNWLSSWIREDDDPFAPSAREGEAAFAASNSSVLSFSRRDFMLGTGGVHGSRVIFFHEQFVKGSRDALELVQDTSNVPIAIGKESTGIFSLGMKDRQNIVAVGGDFIEPDESSRTAAFTSDGGRTWHPAGTLPHGFRSSVAYNPAAKTWITVGPNGTDISQDDGKNWLPLKPSAGEQPDADKNWNALSLPYVVGPNGRIGKLRPTVLNPR